jgi:hypothetical protein
MHSVSYDVTTHLERWAHALEVRNVGHDWPALEHLPVDMRDLVRRVEDSRKECSCDCGKLITSINDALPPGQELPLDRRVRLLVHEYNQLIRERDERKD